MSDKKIYYMNVYQYIKKTKKQLNEIQKIAKRRHPNEDWFGKKTEVDGRVVSIYSTEFVHWLQDVYFNCDGNYLDREIKFYECRIVELLKRLNLFDSSLEFERCLLKNLPLFFNRTKRSIVISIKKLREENGRVYEFKNEDGLIMITEEGVEWLAKNCYKKYYLKKLEIYKLDLQEKLEMEE